MSRLIVKNLPKVVSEQKLRGLFGQKGTITDVQLKYKDGKFRQFAFIGYENEKSAQEAVEFFNDTFVGTSKIKVEVCATLGDESKPQSWSKYAKDSTAFKKKEKLKTSSGNEDTEEVVEKKKTTSEKIDEMFSEYKDDPEFQEFMKANAKDKLAWENDFGINEKKSEENQPDDEKESEEELSDKLANQEISDTDYLKQLMGTSTTTTSLEKKTDKNQIKLYTVKIRNIPKKIKRDELKKFFRPSKAHSIRIPKNQVFACAYVGFKLERDMKRALSKDKSFLKGKQVHVYEFNDKKEDESGLKRINPRWQEQEEKLKSEESICDSGKLFFRNLPYTVTEDDVQKVFEKYGNVVEINVPIDSTTRKIKGFGTVTFLMPEHAVQAYTELNGTMFHGRMFHILPAKTSESKEPEKEEKSDTNFKDKKLKELKKTAAQTHNWNSLFMGSNVVADVISKTYGKSKEDVLSSATGGSEAAVRLALGETQIVLEMKKFLESHGVRLEAFEGDPKKRSKTVILVKNLPSRTNVEEIRTKFAEFGLLEKVILPPSGVTCLVKFADPSEARRAFKKLAYTRFKHVPLYLEWAPENVFTNKGIENNEEKPEVVPEKEEPQKEQVDDTPPENDTTLFVKNLNFQTTEEQLRKVFATVGPIHTVQIAKKKALDGKTLSLGYGFIQYKQKASADKALKNLQYYEIDLHTLELKRSDRTINVPASAVRKGTKKVDQKESTKIMVRNIPFQANVGEVRQLFQVFGELKGIRLPKKAIAGPEQHRGFGFVDFVNKSDAKNAFEALSQSTHLYGRRLVLEWASTEEDLGEIRKRTAEESFGGSERGANKKSRKGFIPDDKLMKSNENEEEIE